MILARDPWKAGGRMYYELYIDVYFLINFMMDICILSVSKKIIKCPATYGSIVFGAFIGAFLSCIVTVLPIGYSFVKFMLFHGLISILMTKTGLRVTWGRSFIKAYMTVYSSAFVIGGIFSCLKQYMREGSIFFVFALLSSMIASFIWDFIAHMGRNKNVCCEVILCQGQNQVKVTAILDTGNRLRDHVTGKPVSIISKRTAKVLWQDIYCENLRYIPYHTIGKKEGVLPVLLLDKMCIYRDEEIWISNVLIAIADEEIGTGEYEVILNSDER